MEGLTMPETYAVFGDSISTFKGIIPEKNRWYYDSDDTNETGISSPEETWWMQAINALDGTFLSNASFSGSMVQGCGFPAACDPERAQQLVAEDGSMPDNVLVFIGINDYGWGSPEAQAGGGSEAAPTCAAELDLAEVDPAGPADDEAAARFGEAYKQMLENIRAAAPEADIWCITLLPGRVADNSSSTFCYRLRGVDFAEYNLAIQDAAEEVGAKVADVDALGFDYDATDGTHPTKDGMTQLASLVCAAILREKGDEDAFAAIMEGYPQRLRAARFCDLPTCIDCEFSTIEPDEWSCVCAKQLP